MKKMLRICSPVSETVGSTSTGGFIAGPLDFREVTEEGGRTHRVLTGDYASWVGSWAAPELPVGQKLREPKVIFRKLDLEQVLEAEG